MNGAHSTYGERERVAAERLVRQSLEEDRAREDRTSELAVPEGLRGIAVLRAREPGVVAGLPCVGLALSELGGEVEVRMLATDGDAVGMGHELARLEGPLRPLLGAERTFLNLLGLLSGTATLTSRFVEAAGPDCQVLDTRKTWPGARHLQKYAVRCGGGVNHRLDLASGVLLKDNHRWSGLSLAELVRRSREEHRELPVVVEVDDLEQLEEVLLLEVDRILLDNFDPERLRAAVALRERLDRSIPFELSGGVTLETVGALARAGADAVSVGALTHSAPALDVGLDLLVGEES